MTFSPLPFLDKVTKTYDGKFLVSRINGVLYVYVWSRLFPKGEVFRYWLNLPTGFILLDDDSQPWMYSVLLKPNPKKLKYPFNIFALGFACRLWCGLKRVHWSCFWCRKRKIFKGKAVNPVKIKLYFAPVFCDVHLSYFRERLVTKLRSFTEFLSGF